MKTPLPFLGLAALIVPLWVACGQMDFTPAGTGDPSRVLTGTIAAQQDNETLPPDTEVAIEVVDPQRTMEKAPNSVLGEPPSVPLQSTLPPKVLGRQVKLPDLLANTSQVVPAPYQTVAALFAGMVQVP